MVCNGFKKPARRKASSGTHAVEAERPRRAADHRRGAVHGEHGLHGDRDLAAGHCARAGHQPAGLETRCHLLSALARHLHSGQRLDRRPLRRPQRVSHRYRRVHPRLDRLRRVTLARRIRHGPHRPGHGRRDDDPGRPADHGAQHRQAPAAQRHGACHRTGADRADLRPAAWRFHHHLRVMALDILDQRADRARRHRRGDALYSQSARRAAPPVRLLGLRSIRPWHRRARLRALRDGARLFAAQRRRRAARHRRCFHDCLCGSCQAHAGADPRS